MRPASPVAFDKWFVFALYRDGSMRYLYNDYSLGENIKEAKMIDSPANANDMCKMYVPRLSGTGGLPVSGVQMYVGKFKIDIDPYNISNSV